MAGTIIADKIQTENAFLTLNVGQTLVATINSSGILNSSGGTMIGANGSVSNTAITGLVTAAQIANVANTQITGNITSSQITSNPTLYGNVSVTGVIGVGGATTSTSGSGISFPATQSASSDANTLDDYEEGTWTPTLANIGTGTYSTNTGTYTKIGNRVYLTVILDINTIGTASGDLQINGFPFTTVSAEPNRSVSGNLLCGSWSSNGTPNIVFMNSSTTTATIQDNQGNTVRTHANMGTGAFRFDISYQTA